MIDMFRSRLYQISAVIGASVADEADLAGAILGISSAQWEHPRIQPLDNVAVAGEYTFLCIRALAAERPPSWLSWVRSVILLATFGCDLHTESKGDATQQDLAAALGNEAAATVPVAILQSAQEPMKALAFAFEELLVRSPNGSRSIILIQQELTSRFKRARDQVRNASTSAELYHEHLWNLLYSLAPECWGPVTKGMVHLHALTTESKAVIEAAFTPEEIRARRILDIEMDEAQANLLATTALTVSIAEAAVRELAKTAYLQGVTAARLWLRECRNIRHFPPRYQFEALDKCLAAGQTTVRALYECIVPYAPPFDGEDLLIKRRSKVREGSLLQWQEMLLSYTLLHEMAHATWAPRSGRDSTNERTDLSLVQFDNALGAEDSHERSMYEPRPPHAGRPAVRSRPGSNPDDIYRLVAEANAVRNTDPLEAVARLRRLRAEVSTYPDGSIRVTAIIDNALAGALRHTGEPGDAVTIYAKALDACRVQFGLTDQLSFIIADNLGGALLEVGNVAASIGIRRRLIEQATQILGAKNETTLRIVHNLAQAYYLAGYPLDARDVLEELLPAARDVLDQWEAAAIDRLLSAVNAVLTDE